MNYFKFFRRTDVLIEGCEMGWNVFVVAGTEWSCSVLQSQPCSGAGTDILTQEERNQLEKKRRRQHNIGECSCSLLSVPLDTKIRVWYPNKTIRIVQERTLSFFCSCLICLTDPQGALVFPVVLYYFLSSFWVGLQVSFVVWFFLWQQLGQTVGGRRRKLGSPSYRLFCG